MEILIPDKWCTQVKKFMSIHMYLELVMETKLLHTTLDVVLSELGVIIPPGY